MKKTVVAAILALAIILFSSVAILPAYPASSGTIFIKPNGSVLPSNVPIQRSGGTYTLTENINHPIVVETNNIVVDGAGYTLQGNVGDVAGNNINSDGVGDSPYEVTTYFASNASGLYTFEDRYPFTAPFKVNAAITQIPSFLTPAETPQPPAPNADNQATAMSFLKNVIQLDLTKYTATLTSDSVRFDSGIPAEYLQYSLSYFHDVFAEQTATASITISNGTVTSLTVMSTGGQLLTTNQTSGNFGFASKIMQNYGAWKSDSEVNKMATLLNIAGSEKNATEQLDNLNLQILATPHYTTFGWSYTYNGADYPIVNLELENASGLNYLTFSDDRAIHTIGDTDISISKQQAITIAENYVKNYAYPMNFGNGTAIVVRNLTVNNAETNATLETALRNPTTLYPYWRVQVALDHIYPGNTQDISVQLWADNGTVFQATREVTPISFPNLNKVILSQMLIWFFSVVVLAAAILVVALILIFRSGKRKQPNSINAQNT